MSDYALVMYKGEQLCVTHDKGDPGNLGELLYRMIKDNPYYDWRDIIVACSKIGFEVVYVRLEYAKKDYKYVYKHVKHSWSKVPHMFKWPETPSEEFLKTGNEEEVCESGSVEAEIHNNGWGAQYYYIYEFMNNKLYVKWEKEDRDWTDFQLVTPELIANWKRNSRIVFRSFGI